MTYLGHVISAEGAKPDAEKVAAVRHWPEPITVKQVRSFVGFCNYYRRFIRNFAEIARPLHELTKKNARFEWTSECQLAFDRLRLELATAPVLPFPQYNCPFIVDTDASNKSLGAVLSNIVDGVERPVVYQSRSLSRTEMNYSTTKREALGIVQALKWFKPYIWGLSFVVRTDHASLRWLFRQNADGMTFRMLQHVQEFDFVIVHRAGAKHANADGLSRQTEEEVPWEEGELERLVGQCPQPKSLNEALETVRDQCHFVSSPSAKPAEDEEELSIAWSRCPSDVAELQREDENIGKILEWCKAKDKPDQENLGQNLVTKSEALQYGPEVVALWALWAELYLKQGVLYRRWLHHDRSEPHYQLIVPMKCRREILVQLHESPVSGGHCGRKNPKPSTTKILVAESATRHRATTSLVLTVRRQNDSRKKEDGRVATLQSWCAVPHSGSGHFGTCDYGHSISS